MKCRTCGQAMSAYAEGEMRDHHLQAMPFDGRCLGCFMFAVELDKFLIRSDGPLMMGDWEDGWMKAILENPRKYL
jgi:hypothetical protein